jgi:hypothetical protein
LWVASLCLFAGATAANAQQIKLLPGDTELIFNINLQQMLKSEMAKENKLLIDLLKAKVKEGLEDKGLAKHLEKAGFDLFRDLHSVTVGVPGARSPDEIFILIEGTFDEDKIETAIKEAGKEAGGGVKATKIAGAKAFEISPQDEKTVFIGILDAKTIIACAVKSDFEEAVARMKGTKSGFKAEIMKKLASTVNAKQSISVIATTKLIGDVGAQAAENFGKAGGRAKQAAEMLKTLEGLSFALSIQKDIEFQIGVNAKDADTAKGIADLGTLALDSIKKKAADKAKEDEQAKTAMEILESIRITAKGSNLIIRGQLNFDTVQKGIDKKFPPKKDTPKDK